MIDSRLSTSRSPPARQVLEKLAAAGAGGETGTPFEAEAPLRMLKPAAAGAAVAASVPLEAGDDDEVMACKFEPIFVFRKPARPAAAVVRTGGSGPGCGPDERSARLADLLDDL